MAIDQANLLNVSAQRVQDQPISDPHEFYTYESSPYTPKGVVSSQTPEVSQGTPTYTQGQVPTSYIPPQQASYQQGGYSPVTGQIAPFVPSGQPYGGPQAGTMQFTDQPGTLPLNAPPPITLASGFPGVDPFTFNFATEQKKAYDSLKPFYDKLLSFAGGRLDLAQRILEYSYQQGMREATGEHSQAVRAQDITFPQEQREQKGEQLRRRIMTSGFAGTERGELGESQNLRREAVDRALQERSSRLTSEKGFGREEKQRGFEEERFGLERERRGESKDITTDKFGLQQAQFGAQLSAASAKESRETQKKQNELLNKQLASYG